ncbi:MAG TPA: hypothetical protein PKA66_05550 [Gemmatimonadales bacterium]|nr:hypothetical protein [Gemmatimonadales bacterium]
MIVRTLLVWLGLMVVAIANGTARQFLLVPQVGVYAGHVLSSVTLSLLILLVAWLSIRWVHPTTVQAAWAVGVCWLTATVVFEFVAGHYLFHHPWSRLLADYDVRQGRVWIVVLVATLVAPRWAAGVRGLFS